MNRLILLLVLLTTTLAAGEAALRLDGRSVVGPRQSIALAATGLPEQVTIPAAPGELLAPGDDPAAVGRGPQLRGPVRLVATIAGKPVAAEAAAPLAAAAEGGAVALRGELAAGAVRLAFSARYAADGAIALEVTPQGGACEALDLVVELAARPDLAIAGPVLDAAPRAYLAAETAPAAGAGTVWSNLGGKGQRSVPGLPASWFVGDGDRGLLVLPAGDAAAWGLDPAQPSLLLERDQAGAATARVRALAEGRFALSYEDVRSVVKPALRHRVILNFEAEAEGVRTDDLLETILKKIKEK